MVLETSYTSHCAWPQSKCTVSQFGHVPVILDDILINTDDDRAAANLKELASLGLVNRDFAKIRAVDQAVTVKKIDLIGVRMIFRGAP